MDEYPAQVRNSGRRRRALSIIVNRRLAVFAAMAAIVAAVCITNPSFASVQNVRDLLTQAARVIIVGCGMTLVVLTGEIDISVGSLLGFLAALLGVLASPSHLGLDWPLVIPITLLTGTLFGLLNGLLVTIGRVPSIVATLGMLTMLRGATELVLGGNWIADLPPEIRTLGTGSLGGLPHSVWAAAAAAVVLGLVARCTRGGG